VIVRRWRHWLGPALAALVAGGILALAVPRLTAQLIGLPARLVERQLEANLTPLPNQLDRAILAGQAAAAWADAGANWEHVARAELALAQQPGLLRNARRSRLERADRALRAALAHAPANPVVWAQLAYVTLARGGDAGVIGDALALSVLTGPNHGGAMPLRSSIAVVAWERLDRGIQLLFKREIVKTMRFAPQQFVETIRHSNAVQVVRAQLEGDPKLQAEFDRVLLILGRR
jgi:hypothetical protein